MLAYLKQRYDYLNLRVRIWLWPWKLRRWKTSMLDAPPAAALRAITATRWKWKDCPDENVSAAMEWLFDHTEALVRHQAEHGRPKMPWHVVLILRAAMVWCVFATAIQLLAGNWLLLAVNVAIFSWEWHNWKVWRHNPTY